MADETMTGGRGTCRGAGDFTLPGAQDHYPPDLQLEPVHLQADLRLDLPRRRLDATVTLRVRGNAAGARHLPLHAVDFAAVDARAADGAELSFTYDGASIVLLWSTPFSVGEEREVELRYHVIDPHTGLFFSTPDKVEPDAPTYAVTDHETQRARYWLACVDHPSVRPTVELRLRADASLTALANGALTGEQLHDDGTKTSTYRLDAPCPSYLTCFAVGDFARWDGGEHDGVPIAAFAPRPYTPADLERTFGRTRELLAHTTERLGRPFPYPKYYQFAARGIGGAMENISLVSWDDRFMLDEALASEEQLLVDVVNAHEMAHAWFGDHVVCRDYADVWLKEGWATYMESCWWERRHGQDAFAYNLWENAEAYFTESKERYSRPIVTRRFNSAWQMYDRHLYPGGGWRLHMLRCLLGDDVFWPAVTDYLERFGGRVVETDDFRRVLEAHSGRSLNRFFDQWLRSPGYPRLAVRFERDAERAIGTFHVEQSQAPDADEGRNGGSEGAHEAAQCFAFDLDLAWKLPGDGDDRWRIERVQVERAHEVFRFSMPQDPEQLRIDPDGRVLHELDFDPGSERLLHQLRDPRDIRGRIQAARGLVKTGKRAHIDAIAEAFENEPFWGVRRAFAKALGEAGSEEALEEIVRLLEHHNDPLSLSSLIRAAGEYRDPRVTTVVSMRLEAGMPPRATEAAYETLGAQRDQAPLTLLTEASAVRGWGGFAQAGALRGLAKTRREEALAPLLARLPRGTSDEHARPAAALALGALARTLDRRPREQAIEALVDALRDRSTRVRMAAAQALAEARAGDEAGATHAVESYAATVSAQERVDLERVLQRLRRGEDAAAKDAAKQVESLRDRLRKVEARVATLEAERLVEPKDAGAGAVERGA
ncbi:MAG: HEAT repeat domain-containing protein [Myxococcales bacterium]|nr:HEAT repeat domain-containing protein [Myxococcales bacterium]